MIIRVSIVKGYDDIPGNQLAGSQDRCADVLKRSQYLLITCDSIYAVYCPVLIAVGVLGEEDGAAIPHPVEEVDPSASFVSNGFDQGQVVYRTHPDVHHALDWC